MVHRSSEIRGTDTYEANRGSPENYLYWNFCPVEVELKNGEVCSYALVYQCTPYMAELSDRKHVLLKELVEIRPLPFAVLSDVLEAASSQGIGMHIGDERCVVETDGKYWTIDASFNPPNYSL